MNASPNDTLAPVGLTIMLQIDVSALTDITSEVRNSYWSTTIFTKMDRHHLNSLHTFFH